MLVEVRGFNPDLIDALRVTHEGFMALELGNLAILGVEGSKYQPEIYSGNIADLLLDSPSTAVMHFEKPNDDAWRGWSVMMAVNYHDGHSEGRHKIVVQDPSRPERGQWELWAPPGSQNKTFYKRTLIKGDPYSFESAPTNPGKIHTYYVHTGSSSDAINDFIASGFEFRDEPLDDTFEPGTLYDNLYKLSNDAGERWDPLADK